MSFASSTLRWAPEPWPDSWMTSTTGFGSTTRNSPADRLGPEARGNSSSPSFLKNPGAAWTQVATPVNDHDFRSDASHIASPYGVFDPVANRGHVFVGTSHDTPAFATDCVSRWWNTDGRSHYPKADKLLILADSGGSNGSRCRAWKHA